MEKKLEFTDRAKNQIKKITKSEEKKYLIDSANTFLKSPISEEDIVWTYAGIRPLLNDQNSNASKVTRDYEFDLDSDELIEKIGRNEFLVDGRLELDVFNQTFQSNLESEDAVTIAGYIIESLESVPEENASFQITNEKMEIIFEIRKMDGNRVENALVVINKI